MIVALAKAQVLRRTNARIDNRSRALSREIAAWLAGLARDEADRAARDPRAYAARALAGRDVAKARTRADREADLRRLIERFGLRAAADAAGQVADRSPSGLLEDALSQRPSVRFFAELRGAAEERARAIVVESVERAERAVSRILLDASRERTTPSTGEIARRVRAAFGRDGGTYAFSQERAAVIARTQLTEAENTGQVAGYEILGVETIEWLAYDDGRSGDRHHERMLRHKPVKLGEHFTLPDGARMRWPGDPLGPVRHKVNCRCGTKPGPRAKPGARRAAGSGAGESEATSTGRARAKPASPERAPAPAPAPQPRLPAPLADPPAAYARDATAPRGSFDRETIAGAIEAVARGDAPAQEKVLRRQLNDLLAAEGLYSYAILDKMPERARVRPSEGSFETFGGMYDPQTGGILIHPRHLADAPAAIRRGVRTDAELRSVSVLVHEAVHGHSPIEYAAYTEAALWIEEATTDLVTRRVLTRRFGADPAAALTRSSYVGAIRRIESVISRGGWPIRRGKGSLVDALEEASVRMRSAPIPRVAKPEAYVDLFAAHLPLDLPAETSADLREIRRVRAEIAAALTAALQYWDGVGQ